MNADERIDLVARAMTDVAPAGDFRARVLASLPARKPRRVARVLVPVAVALSIGSMAWLAGRIAHPSTMPTAVARAATTAASGAITPISVMDDAPGPERRRRPAAGPTAEDLAWQSRAVPRLVPAATLAIVPIQPDALSIAPITVTPVTPPDPIAIGAIDPRAGGR